ncbi:SDR family NAD(P)-dependent oxidoreductase [Actinokineospora fastidiosa]|uniref:Oxidoreductase n=1 Tax=Actinokineospora fastidiosa TaxID=1816 RepID=A0A918GRK7_9PSEU|nr:SDR family NAD(P)-dependent oxidoreductase [Actinokineospora fastidiosa]GGS57315.1 oxidoreductase [Actinokineospora fastidiosa]
MPLAPTADDVLAGHDLTGHHALVTGGTGGIGAETAKALARAGADVLITGRDPVKGAAAAASMGVAFARLDLADPDSIAAFAVPRPVTMLILNAGLLTNALVRTKAGFEPHFGVNHLGHFALAARVPLREARVVVLSSRAHRRADIDFDDPDWRSRAYDPWRAYGQSKTANALFALEFDRRTEHTATAVLPGLVLTDIVRDLTPAQLSAQGWDGRGPGWRTAAQAAASTVWAAVTPGLGGRIVADCAPTEPWPTGHDLPDGHHAAYAADPERAARLWELSERLLPDRAR